MALIDIHVDLSRAVKALERIADALERAFPEFKYDPELISTDGDVIWYADPAGTTITTTGGGDIPDAKYSPRDSA